MMKRASFTKFLSFAGIVALLVVVVLPRFAQAAQITSRKFTLSNSAGAATGVDYDFTSAALPTTGTPVKSVRAEVCTTASGSCTKPSGFSATNANLTSQPSGLGAASSWTDDSVDGALRITHATNSTNPSGAVTVEWDTVSNPTAQNTTFYLRVTTFSDSAYTTALDSGTVAVSTAQQITLSGTMDESLVFCVGTSITGQNCGTVSGSSVNFGTFSTTSTSSGTSVMAASTNAQSGYAITINGTTLTSGGNTINALATQTASTIGTEQFGANLRDNATPNVGADVSGPGTGAPTANYNTVDQFRFVTGDSVASAAAATDADTFTVSYIVNVAGNTDAGTYTATMTYICTATF